MNKSRFSGAAALLSLFAASAPAQAAPDPGSDLTGFVEDSHGSPLAGAVISVFGRSLGGGGLVTLSDAAGRFFLPSLPPGSYTLRALRDGHRPAVARRITVAPDRDAVFTVSLTPLADAAAAAAAAPPEDKSTGAREWQWLTRHKRRSVLESDEAGDADAQTANASIRAQTPDLGGTLEVMTTPGGVGLEDLPLGLESNSASYSILRLDGRLASSGRWSLGGLLSESEATTWRMAAEFVVAPGGGHELQAGLGYGTSYLKTFTDEVVDRGPNRTVGSMFLQDNWQVADRVAITAGGRFTYMAFLPDSNHLDPMLSVQVEDAGGRRYSATAAARTLMPGGDLLALSSIATAPAVALAALEDDLEAERVVRYELAVAQDLGRTAVRAYLYQEDVDNQLSNVFVGGPQARALRIGNAGAMGARGMGLTVGRRLAPGLSGSLTYSLGQGWRRDEAGEVALGPLGASADFHDLVARMEAEIGWSDTRVAAYYRLNSLRPDDRGSESNVTSTRFDVQLSQRVPFIGGLTRADWDLLLAVRNLYYEPDEGASLDEVTVVDPPKRVLGGISVRF